MKKQTKWEMSEDLFIHHQNNHVRGLFSSGHSGLRLKAFLNQETGEIRFFSPITVEEIGYEGVTKYLNK